MPEINVSTLLDLLNANANLNDVIKAYVTQSTIEVARLRSERDELIDKDVKSQETIKSLMLRNSDQ